MKKIVIVIGMVIAAGLAQAAEETTTPTGSNITQKVRRIGKTTDAIPPVLIIDRDEIKRSGATSVSQVLRRIPFAFVSGR